MSFELCDREPMTRTALTEHLRRLAACSAAREWMAATPGTPEELWATCPRGDWLLWLAASAGVGWCVVVLAACDCTEEATPHLTDSARGPALTALETARRWARGEATSEEVRAAADAAYAAAYAAAAAYARSAAAAAAAADAAARSAVYADAAAADAAYAAAYAADAAAYADAASLQRSADIVRARISWTDVEAALVGGRR